MTKLSVNKALLKAKFLIQKGKINEAQKLYEIVLQAFPKNRQAQRELSALTKAKPKNTALDAPPDIINNLLNLYNQSQFSQAVQQANTLIKRYPNAFIIWNILGAANKDLGKLTEASEAFKNVTKLNPTYADGFNNFGITLQEQGKLDQAIEVFKKALSLKPEFAEAHYNMGNALKDQLKLDEAIKAYSKALSIKPDYAEVYNNLGNVRKDQGRLDEAVAAYNRALSIKFDYAEAYNNLGIAYKDQGKAGEATAAFNKALSIMPKYVEAHNNLGVNLQSQGRLIEAIEAYSRALAIQPDYMTAWSNGADALERSNKLEELDQWLEKAAEAISPLPSELRFLQVKLLWRNKKFEEVSNIISKINLENLTENRKPDFLNLKGKYFEKLENFDDAFLCFAKSNFLARQSSDYIRCKPELYFQDLRNTLKKLKSRSFKTPTVERTAEESFTPVFLVGFPRSGTTLLDTILRTHSKIEVVEEKPALQKAALFLEKAGYDVLSGNLIPPDLLTRAKKAYEAEFYRYIEDVAPHKIYIDKMPLNLVKVPLIHQLYPQAKFILALRHPMDCILSCWMQYFKFNAAMANMVDLERLVDFYCVAMDIFKLCRAKYSLSIYEIRYEDILEDLKGELHELLKFLDVDWEAEMENYQKTALKRESVSTPSYSQVVQPIYKSSRYRWLNYEKQLSQFVAQIEPWRREFRYSKN